MAGRTTSSFPAQLFWQQKATLSETEKPVTFLTAKNHFFSPYPMLRFVQVMSNLQEKSILITKPYIVSAVFVLWPIQVNIGKHVQ
jgi:hypothetical protein